MATKKQLTETEKLGRRLQLYVWAGFVLTILIWAITNGKIPNQTLSFLAGTYFLLSAIIGFKTKFKFGLWFEFRLGKWAIFDSTLSLILALVMYLVAFKLS